MDAAYWLAPYGLFSLHSYSAQVHQPPGGTACSELTPSTSVKEVPSRLAHWPVSAEVLFPNSSSLYQVDVELASTQFILCK